MRGLKAHTTKSRGTQSLKDYTMRLVSKKEEERFLEKKKKERKEKENKTKLRAQCWRMPTTLPGP